MNARKTLTVPEAAREIGTTDRALWMQIYRGRFPHRRWGKKVVILRDELEEFLKTLPGLTAAEAMARVGDASK